jgi:hypothetical protein
VVLLPAWQFTDEIAVADGINIPSYWDEDVAEMKIKSITSGPLEFEHRRQPLLSRQDFVRRMIFSLLLAMVLLAIWLVAGMCGYHWLDRLSWIDSFLNAAMIVGGMGPVDALTAPAAKLFAGLYAIFSGVIFLSIFGLLAAPVFHRFLHRFHMDADEKT